MSAFRVASANKFGRVGAKPTPTCAGRRPRFALLSRFVQPLLKRGCGHGVLQRHDELRLSGSNALYSARTCTRRMSYAGSLCSVVRVLRAKVKLERMPSVSARVARVATHQGELQSCLSEICLDFRPPHPYLPFLPFSHLFTLYSLLFLIQK